MTRSPAANPGTGDNRQQEYIITERELQQFCEKGNHLLRCIVGERKRLAEQIRSRPAAGQPTLETMKFNCVPDHKYGVPTSPSSGACRQCKAEKCCVIWDCPLRNEIVATIRNEVLEGLQKIFARNYDSGIYKDQYVAFHAAKDEYLRITPGTADKGGE